MRSLSLPRTASKIRFLKYQRLGWAKLEMFKCFLYSNKLCPFETKFSQNRTAQKKWEWRPQAANTRAPPRPTEPLELRGTRWKPSSRQFGSFGFSNKRDLYSHPSHYSQISPSFFPFPSPEEEFPKFSTAGGKDDSQSWELLIEAEWSLEV